MLTDFPEGKDFNKNSQQNDVDWILYGHKIFWKLTIFYLKK